MFKPGQSVDKVTKTLNTGLFLEYRKTKFQNKEALLVDSPYTLGSSCCMIRLSEDNSVLSSQYRQAFELNKAAAWIRVAGLSGLAIFQVLLAAGLPFGKLARGVRHNKKLPAGLRVGTSSYIKSTTIFLN